MKDVLKSIIPASIWSRLRSVKWRILDVPALAGFVLRPHPRLSLSQRLSFVRHCLHIHRHVDCPHTNTEIMAFARRIFETEPATETVFVEAGCFKGGSSAKFSIACHMVGAKLILCDSFEGIPDNDEEHGRSIFGVEAAFPKGSYAGALDEVRHNISTYGEIGVCEFVKGFFDTTLPGFDRSLSGIYLDVDLASSTRTCIRHLYPVLRPGGYLLSQDGHLPLVIEVFRDPALWTEDLGLPAPPNVCGLGSNKIIELRKTAPA